MSPAMYTRMRSAGVTRFLSRLVAGIVPVLATAPNLMLPCPERLRPPPKGGNPGVTSEGCPWEEPAQRDTEGLEVHGDLGRGIALHELEERPHRPRWELGGEHADLPAVVAEDVGERR